MGEVMRNSVGGVGDCSAGEAATCAIVVTYNPSDQLQHHIVRLVAQFPIVFVVDNGSTVDVAELLRGVHVGGRVHIHANTENLGIAKALNQGLDLAAKAGYFWAVTFDQDTSVSPTLLTSLQAAARECKASGDILVGANYIDLHRNRIAVRARGRKHALISRTTLISSGMLLPVAFALRIGGFCEEYFIDSVDHEFCLRASDNGARILMTREPLMEHRIGQFVPERRWTRWLSSNHPPIRKYYIARNTILTVRAYAARHPLWAIRQMLRLAAESVSIICFESDRKLKSAAFARGLRDGVAKRMTGAHN